MPGPRALRPTVDADGLALAAPRHRVPHLVPDRASPMSEPSSRWFYLQNGRRHGPLDLYGLVDLILKQELTEDTLVWHSGLSEWVKASEREEIRRELPPPVPLSARETALAAPMPVLEAEELEGLEDPLARAASTSHEYRSEERRVGKECRL